MRPPARPPACLPPAERRRGPQPLRFALGRHVLGEARQLPPAGEPGPQGGDASEARIRPGRGADPPPLTAMRAPAPAVSAPACATVQPIRGASAAAPPPLLPLLLSSVLCSAAVITYRHLLTLRSPLFPFRPSTPCPYPFLHRWTPKRWSSSLRSSPSGWPPTPSPTP